MSAPSAERPPKKVSGVTNRPMFEGWRISLWLWPPRWWLGWERPHTRAAAMGQGMNVACYTQTWRIGPLQIVRWVNV